MATPHTIRFLWLFLILFHECVAVPSSYQKSSAFVCSHIIALFSRDRLWLWHRLLQEQHSSGPQALAFNIQSGSARHIPPINECISTWGQMHQGLMASARIIETCLWECSDWIHWSWKEEVEQIVVTVVYDYDVDWEIGMMNSWMRGLNDNDKNPGWPFRKSLGRLHCVICELGTRLVMLVT